MPTDLERQHAQEQLFQALNRISMSETPEYNRENITEGMEEEVYNFCCQDQCRGSQYATKIYDLVSFIECYGERFSSSPISLVKELYSCVWLNVTDLSLSDNHPVIEAALANDTRDQEELKEDEVIEGNIECKTCHCRRIHQFSRQARSADEPPTVYYRCTKCKTKWRI